MTKVFENLLMRDQNPVKLKIKDAIMPLMQECL